uniref:DUF569 domain-containing protein n=1 Tax=Oryza glumipatula TaxID=40148 RepID=A0A0E0AR80_9ORYZ
MAWRRGTSRGYRVGMEVFDDVAFARLRSHVYGSYLHADEDGRSVYHGSLRGGASQHNAVWAVEELLVPALPWRSSAEEEEAATRYLLLRSAYGRYLGATDAAPGEAARNATARAAAASSDVCQPHDREGCCGCCCCCCRLPFGLVEATQRDRDEEEPEVDAIMWLATRCGDQEVQEDRDARGVVLLRDRSGRYLRCNKSILACRRSISVDANFEDEDTLLWEVVRVLPSEDMPELPIATQPGFFVRVCFPQPLREIQFVDEADLDNISEGENWATVQIRGRSVRLLREKIAELVGYDDFTMCVSAGRHGQFTPLLIDLPRRRETLQIVLVRPNTESYDQLIFPNPNALPSAEATDEDDPTIE